jgi:hypothetical protein
MEGFVNLGPYISGLFLIGLCFGHAVRARVQIDTPIIAPEHDVADLYARAASSRFVVVGTVLRSEGVSKRMTPELETEDQG